MKTTFCYSIFCNLIVSNVCTCHNSCAVVTCAKFGNNHFIAIRINKTMLAINFIIYHKNFLVTCASDSPDYSGFPTSMTCIMVVYHKLYGPHAISEGTDACTIYQGFIYDIYSMFSSSKSEVNLP